MQPGIDPASFRDRNARVFHQGGSVYRALGTRGFQEWDALSKTSFFHAHMENGKIVRTERVIPGEVGMPSEWTKDWAGILKHERIPFVSYPYEWSFGMLKEAALLHLDLIMAALEENMILKDSSAYNIQWKGVSPVFIDIGSFEVLRNGEPWTGYRQFCQMFLYPLMLQAYKEIPAQPWLRGCIDGIDPEIFAKMMSFTDMFRPGVFFHVYLQAKAQARCSAAGSNIREGLKSAGFSKAMIETNVTNLSKIINSITWRRLRSEWSHYAKEHGYSDEEYEQKAAFVNDVVHSRRWGLVWDLGCNTGAFSRIAARNADYVVAVDADHLAIDYLYRELKSEGSTNILPLVGNIADPSPNLGWRCLERRSLADRQAPELTLCLALIHHVVISSNIPLREFMDWLASLRTSLIIEFVTKDDPMVKKLLMNKTDNYDDYDVSHFEKCITDYFTLKRKEILISNTRILYFAQKR
jgi:SAM-dependent methyltransferase